MAHSPLSADHLDQLELMPVKPEYRAVFQVVLELARSTLQPERCTESGRMKPRWEPMGVGFYGANLRLAPLFVGVYAYEGVMSLSVSLEKFVRRVPAYRSDDPEDHASLIPDAKRQAVELAKTVLRDALRALEEVEE